MSHSKVTVKVQNLWQKARRDRVFSFARLCGVPVVSKTP